MNLFGAMYDKTMIWSKHRSHFFPDSPRCDVNPNVHVEATKRNEIRFVHDHCLRLGRHGWLRLGLLCL